MSGGILNELDATLNKPYFRKWLSEAMIVEVLEVLYREAQVTPISVPIHVVVRDPKDDHIIAAAVSANAQFIVSGDDDLHDLGSYQHINIVTARQFLEILAPPDIDLDT